MLKLATHEHVLSDVANKLGLRKIHELLLSRSDGDVASALAEYPDLAEKVLQARAELRRIAESGDERVANLIVNYVLLRTGGYTIPRALAVELARAIPGIYVVSGERVLVPKPFESPPSDVSVDGEYMDAVAEHMIKVGDRSLVVAGTEYGIVDYSYLYRVLFNTRIAEAAVLRKLIEACNDKNIPWLGERVYRKDSTIVAEVDVDLNALAKAGRITELPGRMKLSLMVGRDGKTGILAMYEDNLLVRSASVNTDYVSSYIEELVDKVITSLKRNYELVKDARELAESKGYKWLVSENTSTATKTVKINNHDVSVEIMYSVGDYTSVSVMLVAPSTDEMLNVMHSLESVLEGRVFEEENTVSFATYHELTRETALSATELAESLLAKLRRLLEEAKPAKEQVDEAKLIGALLLKAVKPEAYVGVFEKLDTSFLEALRTVFKDATHYEISKMYANPREILPALAKHVDVVSNGEPTIFGRVVDEYLAPFNVDRKTVLSVKRAIVEAYTTTQSASLSATLLVRGTQLTPELVKKLIAYGDMTPLPVLEQEYNGAPIWHHLSNSEKLAVAIKLAKKRDYWDALMKSDILTHGDGKILAKAACTAKLADCTALAFSELRDELQVPRHAVLREVAGDVCIDTGAYLVKIEDYDINTDTYTFRVRLKASDKYIDVKGRSMREALLRASEEEELQPA